MSDVDEEVVVWGHRSGVAFCSVGGSGPSVNENDGVSPHPQLEPGGGGGGPPLYTQLITAECPTADTTARRAADQINNTPSSASQEWGAQSFDGQQQSLR